MTRPSAATSPASASPEIMISVRDLRVQYESGGGLVTVLNGVSFDVYRGETLIIMGGSGSGKSTLLNCMIGEIAPVGGEILYHLPDDGMVNLCHADARTANRIRRLFGILFQSGALFSSLTVAENVALPLLEHAEVDRSVVDIVVAMKLQQVHMLAHREKYPSQLSGGQKKRVGLARATALDPQILFYDEPSAGLDPITTSAIDALMADLSRKLSVTSVVVTHDMTSAFRIANRMVMLDSGRIIRAGTRDDFARLRDAEPEALTQREDRRIQQFLLGSHRGPIADSESMVLYERILAGESAVLHTR